MSKLAEKYWSIKHDTHCAIFTHVDGGERFVWIDGVWIEMELNRSGWRIVPGSPNIRECLDLSTAMSAGWDFLEDCEQEAFESSQRYEKSDETEWGY